MKSFIRTVLFVLGSVLLPLNAMALETGSYPAAIWIDPEGCEHWVLDLGTEGMMSPRLDREGKPVCGRSTEICMEFPDDVLFKVDEAILSASAIDLLRSYFSKEMASGTSSFIIKGHTDSTGGTYYNFDLGRARAEAVAAIAREFGAMTQVESYGELQPIASNDTEDGRRRNRRVEILCE